MIIQKLRLGLVLHLSFLQLCGLRTKKGILKCLATCNPDAQNYLSAYCIVPIVDADNEISSMQSLSSLANHFDLRFLWDLRQQFRQHADMNHIPVPGTRAI